MSYGLTVVTGPTQEPVSLDELKKHVDCDRTDQDAMLSQFIKAARQMVESATNRQLVYATYDLTCDRWPCTNTFYFPLAPLRDVVSVQYYNAANTLTLLASSNYIETTNEEPGHFSLVNGVSWPTLYPRRGAVKIQFDCGYTANACDERAKQAVLMLAGHWYENRESVLVGTISKEIEHAYTSLVSSLCWGDEWLELGGRKLEVSYA